MPVPHHKAIYQWIGQYATDDGASTPKRVLPPPEAPSEFTSESPSLPFPLLPRSPPSLPFPRSLAPSLSRSLAPSLPPFSPFPSLPQSSLAPSLARSPPLPSLSPLVSVSPSEIQTPNPSLPRSEEESTSLTRPRHGWWLRWWWGSTVMYSATAFPGHDRRAVPTAFKLSEADKLTGSREGLGPGGGGGGGGVPVDPGGP